MVRKLEKKDIDKLMKIWFETNINTHNFIDENYWKNHYNETKDGILNADTYVYEENNEIAGFIGIIDGYIAGIFVKKDMQRKGIGKNLINIVKGKYNDLTLNVYGKNTKAIEFYKKLGFKIIKKRIDEATKESELFMKWIKK